MDIAQFESLLPGGNAEAFAEAYGAYLGNIAGCGVDLLSTLRAIESAKLERLAEAVRQVRDQSGRVFVVGNGGSFDNALLMAQELRAQGVQALVPGNPDGYFSEGVPYAQLFSSALVREAVEIRDLVVGLSGSGNSANVIEAFTLAKEAGAAVFALGGRDGGKMAVIAGEHNSLVVRSISMEAIEDAHAAIALIVSQLLQGPGAAALVHTTFLEAYSTILTHSNLRGLSRIARGVLQCALTNSSLFVGGVGIGPRHVRADAQRGFTNSLPIRGLVAPELFTTNSAMATANDDGAEYILVDGLAKYSPTAKDFSLLFATTKNDSFVPPYREMLDERGVPYATVGFAQDCDVCIAPFARTFDTDFCCSLIGHATGVIVRETLSALFEVRRLSPSEATTLALTGRRKLNPAGTRMLEGLLREQRVLSDDEVITFAYGDVFAAQNPEKFGLERVYY